MFDLSKVVSVYSGRIGCACGCMGKYTYASQHKAWAEERRGYEIEADEVNDRTVKTIVNKIEKIVCEQPYRIDWLMDENGIFAINMKDTNRAYTIYFKED